MAKVLIIDDEEPIRIMISEELTTQKHQCQVACDGEEALKIIAQDVPDIVITDLVMPKVNGLDLIMELRKISPSLPIIAISGGGGIDTNYDYLEISKLIGAGHVFSKPFSLKDLSSLANEIVANTL